MNEARIISGSEWRELAVAAEVELRILREELRIATAALTNIVEGQYPGAALVAEDALIQMSVVEAA